MLDGKFVISYLGTLGVSQGLSSVLVGAQQLSERGYDRLHFLIVGDGAEKRRLQDQTARFRLKNVSFLPAQPFSSVQSFYRSSDIVLVSLKKLGLFLHTVPSKLYEIMASQAPVLCMVAGECREIVDEAQCGWCIEPESPTELADKLIELSSSRPEDLESRGNNGRVWVLKNANRKRQADEYLRVLKGILSTT
jgi:glycosyltransferase involved in cell wall biosynthesis